MTPEHQESKEVVEHLSNGNDHWRLFVEVQAACEFRATLRALSLRSECSNASGCWVVHWSDVPSFEEWPKLSEMQGKYPDLTGDLSTQGFLDQIRSQW